MEYDDIQNITSKTIALIIALIYLTGVLFFIGYFYGMGIYNFFELPVTTSDIIRYSISISPATLIISLAIFIMATKQFSLDEKKTEPIKTSKLMTLIYLSAILFYIYLIYSNGFNLTLFCFIMLLIGNLLLDYLAKNTILNNILKLSIITTVMFFLFGFIFGNHTINSKKYNTIVYLNTKPDQKIKVSIIAYMSSYLIVKTQNAIIYIPNDNIRLIERITGSNTKSYPHAQ